jgi:hypothetical protein
MDHSDFLVSMPSFLRGAGRIGDLFASSSHFSYNESATPEQADARAIAHDWAQVGQDLARAMVPEVPAPAK